MEHVIDLRHMKNILFDLAGHCVSKAGVLIASHLVEILAGVNNYSDYFQVGRQSLIVSSLRLYYIINGSTS